MQTRFQSAVLGAVALISSIPTLSAAGTIELRRDDVVPVIIQSELTFKNTRRGDTFRGEVTDTRLLPLGTRVEGKVNRVEQRRGDQPGFMDIEFTTILLPDGTRTNFRAIPISMGSQYVSRGRDGRWEAKKGVKKETVVLGTTAGGLILGSLIKKPFEGAILGALAGILVAETDKQNIGDGNIVIAKGAKIGARVDRDVRISWDNRYDDRGYGDYGRDGYNSEGYDRYGYDRNGRYNPRYDESRRDDRSSGGSYGRDGYNSEGYDRFGYDRNGRYNPRYDESRRDDRSSGGSYGRDGYNNEGYDRYGYDRNGRYNPRYDESRNGDRGNETRELRVEVEGKALRFSGDERPYNAGGTVMVPLKRTASQLNLDVREDRRTSSFSIEGEFDRIQLEQDSRTYRLNDRRGTLGAAVETRSGVVYIPIEVISMLKRDVRVNGTRY